jgi:hypothetical protein
MIVTECRVRRLSPPPLLLGAALLLAGCSTCPKYLSEKSPEPVNILVLSIPEPPHVVVFPDTARLCEGKQYPLWVLSGTPVGARLEISFTGPEGSPFFSSEEKPGAIVKYGVAKPGTAGRRYPYTVTIRNAAGEKAASFDPNVEIWR